MEKAQKKTVFLIGDAGPFQDQFLAHLEESGVATCRFDSAAQPEEILAKQEDLEGPVRVVFGPTELNELDLLSQDVASGGAVLVSTIEERSKSFLAQIQAALRLLMASGGGQIWVCDYDDTFAYHMDVPSAPILAQARAGAVRSLAKEYSRMKIAINSFFMQPLEHDDNKASFRKAAAGLKSYAMRYKPHKADEVAGLLKDFVERDSLTFSGNSIGTGTGILQGHLSQ